MAVDSELVSVVSALIQKHGGLPGIVEHLHQHGLGTAVPMSVDQVHEVFGSSTLIELSVRLGVSPQALARHICELLPQAIDYLAQRGQ